MTQTNISKVLFPKKANRTDYFKAAVLYIISENIPTFEYCEERKKSHLEDAKVKALIKAAVPGYNSTLMHMEIVTNVHMHIIDDATLDLNQKISKIADSIRKYVYVAA